jgi:hypothetical protein
MRAELTQRFRIWIKTKQAGLIQASGIQRLSIPNSIAPGDQTTKEDARENHKIQREPAMRTGWPVFVRFS